MGLNEHNIEHKGSIVAIIGNRVDVEMIVEEACSACKAKDICGMGHTEHKVVSVIVDDPTLFEVDETVIVSVTRGMGIKAVMLAYVFPFLLLLGTLMVLLGVGCSESVAGLIALGLMAVYYAILYFLRKKIEREIIFKIRK